MREKPEALRLADEYAQEVKDFGYVENSYVRAKLKNRLACLHAEVEALLADARRYRWLTADHHKHETRTMVYKSALLFNTRRKEYVDAAIDAAMEQT